MKAGDQGIPSDPTVWAEKYLKDKGSGNDAVTPAGIQGCVQATKINIEIRESYFIVFFGSIVTLPLLFDSNQREGDWDYLYIISLSTKIIEAIAKLPVGIEINELWLADQKILSLGS